MIPPIRNTLIYSYEFEHFKLYYMYYIYFENVDILDILIHFFFILRIVVLLTRNDNS